LMSICVLCGANNDWDESDVLAVWLMHEDWEVRIRLKAESAIENQALFVVQVVFEGGVQ
jgi:hypothetical protein